MTRLLYVLTVAGTMVLASPLSGQGKGLRGDDIPPAYRPPPGMCRIWIDGVPPGQQPAPTDCATAVRNRPPNARVIFGDDVRQRPKGKDRSRSPMLWGLLGVRPDRATPFAASGRARPVGVDHRRDRRGARGTGG